MAGAFPLPERGMNEPVRRSLLDRLRGADQMAHVLTMVFAAAILLIVVLLVFELFRNSVESRSKFGWEFFFTSQWDPVPGSSALCRSFTALW